MDQEQKIDTPADEESKVAARRPWHAPRFFVTDVIATDAMCIAGKDANNSLS